MPLDAKMIVKQFEEVAGERHTFEDSWQNIADHILGRRDFTSNTIEPGRRRMQTIYDTTALFSVSTLGGGLNSLLTNPASKWFHLKPFDERLLQIRDVALWFEDAERVMYNAINHPRGRFASQCHETYMEIVAFGTGALYIDDDPRRGILYSARPLSEIYVSEDEQGVVDTVFRKFPFTARQAVQAWGKDAPEKAHKSLDAGKSEDKLSYLHLVRPNEGPKPLPFNRNGFPWMSAYLCLDTKQIVDEGGFWEMPYMVTRWEKDPGETYGRGPGFTALPDAKMLNEMSKTLLQTGQLKVRPPMLMQDEGAQLDMRPGGRNYSRPGFLDPPIQPIPIGGDLGWGVELIKDKREQVQRAFHWELLQLIRDPRMTATQVIEIADNLQRLLSPILGRFHVELLEPIIERTFGILYRRGEFMNPPIELSNTGIKVEYVSPVARAQREQDARAIVDLFTVGANLAQADPSVLDVLDSEEAVRFIGEAKGVPISVLRSRIEVEEIRQAQRELAEQQYAIKDAQAIAETAAKVAPAIQGSMRGGQA